MDIGLIAAIAMLVLWAIATLLYSVPGWMHLLLTFGVFLLIWRIVKTGNATSRSRSGPGKGS
ncbi:MAG TPA: hypothetical protein VKZ41_04745 [Gemmatimonadales bacterium]|nr:hypothetical protein [Gemmatimonadales bacterium]